MADTSIIYVKTDSQASVPIKAVDNGDGTYSLSVATPTALNAINSGELAVPSITVDTAAYIAADGVGGILTLANFVDYAGQAYIIDSISLTESGAQIPGLLLGFFRATPAGGTYADNSALAIDLTDLADLVGFVEVLSASWKTFGGKSVQMIGGIEMVGTCTATSCFMLIQTTTAYDAAAATDLGIKIGYRKL